MKLFDHRSRSLSSRHADVARQYEIWRTLVEFLAAVSFIVGSIFFFYPDWVYTGTWLFVIGSVLFTVRPTIRLALELHLTGIPVSGKSGRGASD